MMNIPVETANAAMSLAGGALALLAAIIAAVAAIVPKESAAAMAQLRAKAFSFFTVASAIASSVSIVFLDAPRLALFFIVICASLTSVSYLRNKHPATRAETFVLIIQIALVLAFAFLYMGNRMLSLLERLA